MIIKIAWVRKTGGVPSPEYLIREVDSPNEANRVIEELYSDQRTVMASWKGVSEGD